MRGVVRGALQVACLQSLCIGRELDCFRVLDVNNNKEKENKVETEVHA